MCFEALNSYIIDSCIEALKLMGLLIKSVSRLCIVKYRRDIMVRLLTLHSTLVYPMKKVEGFLAERRTNSLRDQTNDDEWIQLNEAISDIFELIKSSLSINETELIALMGQFKGKYQPEHLSSFMADVPVTWNGPVEVHSI